MNLFEEANLKSSQPLAARMRPRNLDEYIGQDHIIGKGRLLRRVIQADRLSSLIFYGPPGTGKTTLAQVIANTTKSKFVSLNAVLSGVKELRAEIDRAKERKTHYNTKTILFIDEVHRWNKSQQDALLPWVENGTLILIGATTENPFFEVNKALVSRSRIFQLTKLSENDLQKVAEQTLNDKERGYGSYRVQFETGALEHLVKTANGDARNLLNALELAVETTPEDFPPQKDEEIYITTKTAEESIQQKVVLYDKSGDYHYDTISAFIKSIRGSDPDATLYWLAKMLSAGEDPKFIFRRMIISACEDIGLADPNALIIANSGAAAFDRIGMPEGRFILSETAIYLATCKKSNSTFALFDAISTVDTQTNDLIPPHLRDASRDGEELGHGKGYLYPHAYKDHWVAQQYLPTSLQGKIFYNPSKQGDEAKIAKEIQEKRELQLSQISSKEQDEEILISPKIKNSDARFIQQINNTNNQTLKEIKDKIFSNLKIKNHYNILNLNSSGGLFLWESIRKAPNGSVWIIVKDKKEEEIIKHYSQNLDINIQPQIAKNYKELPDMKFEIIVAKDIFTKKENIKENIKILEKLYKNSQISISQIMPLESTKLSDLTQKLDPKISEILKECEKTIYKKENSKYISDIKEITENSKIDFSIEKTKLKSQKYISSQQIKEWLSPNGIYGKELQSKTKENIENMEEINKIKKIEEKLLQNIANKSHNWTKTVYFLKK